ncbi:MAG: hypothetical protein ACJA1C_000927 [Crocinitomicaceae bacterium]|jgi:hypothetical protein
MSFVNKYNSPSVVLKNSAEFLEGSTTFVYTLGEADELPAIIKSDENGVTVWEKKISHSYTGSLVLKNIVQLGATESTKYVISADEGSMHVLISISSDGTLQWIEDFPTSNSDMSSWILSEPNGGYFYFVFNDKSSVPFPVVMKMIASGAINSQVSLSTTAPNNSGFQIVAAKPDSGGLVLAGDLLQGRSTEGIIVRLGSKLKVLDAKSFAQHALNIHDIAINGTNDYTFTSYSTVARDVMICQFTGTGVKTYYSFSGSASKKSFLAKADTKLLMALNDTNNGEIYRFDSNLGVDWQKQFDNSSNLFGAQTMQYLRNTDEVSITSQEDDILLHLDVDLTSCITTELTEEELNSATITVVDVVVNNASTEYEGTSRTGSVIVLASDREDVCDPCDVDSHLCGLYDSMIAKYRACFSVQLVPQQNFTSIASCATTILADFTAFNSANPSYGLATLFATEITTINTFISTPNEANYLVADDAFHLILDYLVEHGNCECGAEGDLEISENAMLQSGHLYLQSAGSVGVESTKGVHLRWLLKGGLSRHLPKADYAIPNNNFNKNDDFVRIYRAPYVSLKTTVNLSIAPNLNDDANAEWMYVVGTNVFYVRFKNIAQYATVRTTIDPATNPTGFMSAYGNSLIEIENENELSFAVTMTFSPATSGTVDLELLSVEENDITSPKKTTLRKVFTTTNLSGIRQTSENIRSARFVANGAALVKIEFEFYSTFINSATSQGAWQYYGKHALTKNTTLAFNRLEPVTDIVQDSWLRYNDDAFVNVQNYKTKWNDVSVPVDSQIISTIDTYIDLSNDDANPDATELVYFNDPAAPPLPGFDPSDNQFELSNLYILQLASMDYHVARMLGLGILDIDPALDNNDEYMYLAEYTSFGDLDDGLGAREVQHIYCSLPTAETDERLPVPIDLKVPSPGVSQGMGTEAPTLMTDDDGYSIDGKARFLSLFHEELISEEEDAPFFSSTDEFISSEGTQPVFAGIEYKLTAETDWVKPELPHDKVYFNVDSTVPAADTNETRSIVLPELGYPLFVHREKQSGWHDYSSYGINWFSRATSSTVVHSIETTITPTNHLQPPTNINAVLIREESPLFLSSADEQVEFSNIAGTDKTYVRLGFEYNHGQELIDYHKEVNGVQNPGYYELPDNEELFAENIEVFFRNEIPNSVSGKILSVADDVNPILSIVTTDEYVLASQPAPDNVLTPEVPIGTEANYVGGAISIEGVNYIIHLVDNTGTYPVFTIFKNDANGFPIDLTTSIPAGDLTSPDAGGLFILVENMLTPTSWSAPNPLSFAVNIDHTTVYSEEITIELPDGNNQTHNQKFRGVYENALIEKFLEDHDGDNDDGVDPSDTPLEHLGLYKITFTGFDLADHSQSTGTGHRVEFNKGVVRVHTVNNMNGERKSLHVMRTENIGTTNDLIIYAADPTFDTDPSYDEINIGTNLVNYYPGYRTYLFEDATYGINEANTLPGVDEDIHYSIFGFRSHDTALGFYSKISVPTLMYAQKIEAPLQPGIPEGSKYATRPDFFGKASYTFTNTYLHKPYSVQFRRASDIQMLTSLWRTDDGGNPLIWTTARIKSEIFDNGNADFYQERWTNLLGFDYVYPSDAANDGNFERFPDPAGTSLPLPNSITLIDSINVFIVNHNDYFTATVPTITAITDLYQVIIPVGPNNVELLAVDFIKDVIHNCFVPLTEIPVLYEHIKDVNYKPIPKKQKTRDANGNLLSPSDPEFDMAPMMKVIGPNGPITDDITQFTDFGIDGASNAKYFYVAREMSLQMKTGPFSPILGPVNLVNTAPPKAPEIVKITAVLENRELLIDPSIKIQFNGYASHQNITEINIYRTSNPQEALSIRTMTKLPSVDATTMQGDAVWTISDDFSDLGYVPYGDPLFYLITVSREIKYNDKNGVLVEEVQPSEASKMTITNIVEKYNPEAPALEYYSDPLSVANELDTVTFKWPKTVHNGSYSLHKKNDKGNWVKLHDIQSNDDEIVLQLLDTDYADDTLLVEDADGNPIYHIFKIVATNFAGMVSRKEKLLSIYDVSTWNDIANI